MTKGRKDRKENNIGWTNKGIQKATRKDSWR
jgi:hypothetical protein